MNIFLTGASSFTGAWFVWALARGGHQVCGALQRNISEYSPLQQARFAFMQSAGVRLLENHPFGQGEFLRTLNEGFDVLCLHGAHVGDYKSPEFDVLGAVNANVFNLRQVVRVAKESGVRRLIATGSVFEEGEGAGDSPLKAVSSYGLSKSITWSLIQHYCELAELPVGKFVIPNPFGPYEEPRFCGYLMRSWAAGISPQVNTPSYIRDNIPIGLLAAAYLKFVETSVEGDAPVCMRPSGYVESQGSFTLRFAREVGLRLDLPTPFECALQSEFPEPRMRVNTDRVDEGWDETGFWDELASYYQTVYLNERMS